MDPNYRDPGDTYRAYQKFLKKREYPKAYRCLERLLKEFPDDLELSGEMLRLTLHRLNDPKRAQPWVKALAERTSSWTEYLLLSEVEAELGNIPKAKAYLEVATALQEKQRSAVPPPRRAKSLLSHARDLIKQQEHNLASKKLSAMAGASTREKEMTVKFVATVSVKDVTGREPSEKAEAPAYLPLGERKEAAAHRLPIRFDLPDLNSASSMLGHVSPLKDCLLGIEYAHLTLQKGFDDLLCLRAMKGVERYWYQVETAKKVLKYFHGRVLLCDEVGLGKTIEAGMLMKEYLLRGMVKNILILAPPPLVSQWKEEMDQKFGIGFVTPEDSLFSADPDRFWKSRFIIASIHTAKGDKNFHRVVSEFYDLVVVDEAHHLRNKRTLSWKLVNEIKKRFIFLLTATPVQNNLMELFHLITLLKPGQFRTERLFKQEFVKRGDPRRPAHQEKLRELLRDVMIRNTRSTIDLKLPRRFASTLRLDPTEGEREVYDRITAVAREPSDPLSKPLVQLLLGKREAVPSPSMKP